MKIGWQSWDCSDQRWKALVRSYCHFPVCKGGIQERPRELRETLLGNVVLGQGVMALNWRRMETNKRMRGNCPKLDKGRFRLDARENFFIVKVVKFWNSSVVDAPSLSMLKRYLDNALNNFWFALNRSGSCTRWSLKVFSNWTILD